MIKLPNGINIVCLIDDLRIFSWEAADVLLHYSQILTGSDNKDNLIKSKGDNDPVTAADLSVNSLIINRINNKYPLADWVIVSEENVKPNDPIYDQYSDWLWLFDPLDGTKDFIQGTGNYAMHLSLNYKNNPYLGFVLIPGKEELWITNGSKTWCEDRKGQNKFLSTSLGKNLNQMRLVMSKNHKNEYLKNLVDHIPFSKIENMGSIGCKIASLIRGDNDIYISLSIPNGSCPKDWDFAAPQAILKNAGGDITTLENEDLIYNKENFLQGGIIIATNCKKNHKLICEQIKSVVLENNLLPFYS